MNPIRPDVVMVGGGPVGLWTAIQAKLLAPEREFLVLEQYAEYQRDKIQLQIEESSLHTNCEMLWKLTAKWAGRIVPIKEMEDGLVQLAHEVGITTLHGVRADPATLQEQYPSAKLFIGADGARSAMRQHFVNGYWFHTPLQYLAQVEYRIGIPEEERSDSSWGKIEHTVDNYKKLKFAGHLISQRISPIKDQPAAKVTLQIFIDQETYQEMEKATFKNPYYVEKDFDKIPDSVRNTVIRWWGCNADQNILIDRKNTTITAIQLTSYAAKEFVVAPENGPPVVLIGDAAQAYPFFRAINNGLLTGTKLAECIGQFFQGVPTEKAFTPYIRYATWRAPIEWITAFFKNLFIQLSNWWVRISGRVSWQVVKIDAASQIRCYERGAFFWEQFSQVASYRPC